jgi:hypothetical protein
MKHLLTTLFLALSIAAQAQTIALDITWRDTTTIGADMTYAQAKTRWPAWVGYMEYIGASSRVLNTRKCAAAHNNIVWANDDGPGVTNYANGCQSRVNPEWPHGAFRVDAELIKPQGIVRGQGSQGYQLDSWSVKPGGTTLIYDHAGWDGVGNHAGYGGDASQRFLFKDMTWGRVDNFGYTEGAQLIGFKIEGQGTGLHNPAYHFSAIGAWKAGEIYLIEDVFIYNANNFGIELGGQFHATFYSERVSIFKSGIGAYGIFGGAHMQLHMGSFDDNGDVFHVRPDSKGSIGNGTAIKCYGIKFETGKTDARPYSRGQQLLDADGVWVMLDVYGFYYSKVNSMPHSLMRVKSQSGLRCTVNLYGVTWFDKPAYMLHDRNKAVQFRMDQQGFSSAVTAWSWNSIDGVTFSPGVTLAPEPATCDQRLAPLPRDPMTGSAVGTWSGCSPLYSYTQPIASEGGPVQPPGPVTPPPTPVDPPPVVVPPTPLALVWASTFSGTNRCRLAATTGTASTQGTTWACAQSVTGGNVTTAHCTSFPLAIAARRVILLGVTFSSWGDYAPLNSAMNIKANGEIVLAGTAGPAIGTVTRGVKYDRLTLDLPMGTRLSSIIGPADRNTCGCPVFTAEAVEVYN